MAFLQGRLELLVNLVFCLGGLLLCTIGHRLVKRGSPFSRSGGDTFARKKRRKTIGLMFWAAGGALLILTLVRFAYSSGPSTVPDATIAEDNSHGYTAPVLPPVPSDVAKADAILPTPKPGEDVVPEPSPSPSEQNLSHGENAAGQAPAAQENLRDTNQVWTPPPLRIGPSAVMSRNGPPSAADEQKQLEAEMDAANTLIQKDASNPVGYVLRGNVYGKKKMWDQAKKDYEHALELKSQFTPALFNLAELDFIQLKFDVSRPGFVALEQDPDFGDIARYHVFLCDLMGGHEEAAAKELDAFNKVGSNASYYFANAAWYLYHKDDDQARGWIGSALRIYPAAKVHLYATPLVDLDLLQTKPTQAPTK
jgi:hypothetical protein